MDSNKHIHGGVAVASDDNGIAVLGSADAAYKQVALNSDGSVKLPGGDYAADRLKVEPRYAYANIAAAASTLVKTGPGTLRSITVNKGVAGTITIYDGTTASGTKIGTITMPADWLGTLTFDAAFAVGLYIVTSVASDITVSYR